MKKALLVSEIFPPINGGSGRWFWELYSRLPKNKFVIAVGKSEHAKAFDTTHDLTISRINLSSSAWGLLSIRGISFYWKTFWVLKALIKKNNIEVLHCGRCLPEGVLGMIMKITLNIPYLCYVHGEDVETALTSRELTWLVKQTLNRADTLICNSENTKKILLDIWGIPTHKIAVLNPGVDTNRFKPEKKSITVCKNLGWEERAVILTVGRLQKRKGHEVMIAALSAIKNKYPNVLYAIIGNGEELDNLKALVQSLHLQDNVQFMLEVDDDTMIKCYQQCDIFILPNRTEGNDIEGFGMVLVEAQACGKPVIAGDSGGTSETMRVNKTGFIIDCRTPKQIEIKINELLSNSAKLLKIGVLAREHVCTNLDWEQHKDNALQIFNKIKA